MYSGSPSFAKNAVMDDCGFSVKKPLWITVGFSVAQRGYALAVFEYAGKMTVIAESKLFRDLADTYGSACQKVACFQDSLLFDILLWRLMIPFFETFNKIGQTYAAHVGEQAVGIVFSQMGLYIAFCHFPGNGRVFRALCIGIIRQSQ